MAHPTPKAYHSSMVRYLPKHHGSVALVVPDATVAPIEVLDQPHVQPPNHQPPQPQQPAIDIGTPPRLAARPPRMAPTFPKSRLLPVVPKQLQPARLPSPPPRPSIHARNSLQDSLTYSASAMCAFMRQVDGRLSALEHRQDVLERRHRRFLEEAMPASRIRQRDRSRSRASSRSLGIRSDARSRSGRS